MLYVNGDFLRTHSGNEALVKFFILGAALTSEMIPLDLFPQITLQKKCHNEIFTRALS